MSTLGDMPSPYGMAADLLDPDPPSITEWATSRLEATLWWKQEEIGASVVANKKTAVKSAHDTGKSFVSALIGAWWLDTHFPGEAFLVSTAPTFHQVKMILWREIGKMHRKGKLLGRVNQTEWYIGNEPIGYGRKPADYDEDAFQGIHAPYVLVILDEATGVPPQLWDAVETITTGRHCRILAIGNPDDPTSHFKTVCNPGSGWNVITIKAWDTPNFTPRDDRYSLAMWDRFRDVLLDPEWVEDKRKTWGETDPRWISKVEAEFPEDAEDGVVPASWAARCQREEEHPAEDLVPVELGIDIGAGGDLTVIQERRGVVAGRTWTENSRDPEIVTGKCMAAIRSIMGHKKRPEKLRVKIDVIGWGWGVMGSMRTEIRRDSDLNGRVEVIPVNVGEASSDKKRFVRLRDEVWWMARELSESGTWDLSSVPDETISQLIAPKWALDASGKIKVEKKDDTKERLGSSPDYADALILAFYAGSGRSRRPVSG